MQEIAARNKIPHRIPCAEYYSMQEIPARNKIPLRIPCAEYYSMQGIPAGNIIHNEVKVCKYFTQGIPAWNIFLCNFYLSTFYKHYLAQEFPEGISCAEYYFLKGFPMRSNIHHRGFLCGVIFPAGMTCAK